MPYAMGDINTAAAFADFGNSLFMERCGVQATVWRRRGVFVCEYRPGGNSYDGNPRCIPSGCDSWVIFAAVRGQKTKSR
jgi:hypothetical protein